MDLITSGNLNFVFGMLSDPYIFLFLIVGAAIGLLFGATPGLTAPAGVALMLPFTYGLNLNASLALLLGIYCSGYFAGSIPGILINTPGTPGNAATSMDGYPMAKNGEANRAITTAIISSAIGGFVALLLLLTLAPVLASFALNITSVEYFSLALLGIACVAGISAGSMLKGFAAAIIGLFVATIGIDPVSGVTRFVYGVPHLLGGIPIIPVLIGLFALSAMLVQAEKRGLDSQELIPVSNSVSILSVIQDHIKNKWLALRSALVGSFIGLLPGTGPAIASWIAYGDAVRSQKPGDKFGKGEVKGVIACESSNNAVTGGAMIPLLTLGIPGDPVTAILIGALMIHGIEPGPFFIRDQGGLFIAIVMLLFLANIAMVLMALSSRRIIANLLTIPAYIIIPTIILVAASGVYALHHSAFDLKLMAIFGAIGFIMVRYKFPVAPAVLGLVLGPILESNLRNALVANDMNVFIFFTRPISAIVLVAMVALLWIFARKTKSPDADQVL